MEIEPNIDGHIWLPEHMEDAEFDIRTMASFLGREIGKIVNQIEEHERRTRLPDYPVSSIPVQDNLQRVKNMVERVKELEKHCVNYAKQFSILRERAEACAAKIVLTDGVAQEEHEEKTPGGPISSLYSSHPKGFVFPSYPLNNGPHKLPFPVPPTSAGGHP